jgi:hypothetical protein
MVARWYDREPKIISLMLVLITKTTHVDLPIFHYFGILGKNNSATLSVLITKMSQRPLKC